MFPFLSSLCECQIPICTSHAQYCNLCKYCSVLLAVVKDLKKVQVPFLKVFKPSEEKGWHISADLR